MTAAPECIRLLIAAGADPNLQAVVRDVARSRGPAHLQSVIALLRAGADPNIATRRCGRTALLYMAASGVNARCRRLKQRRRRRVVDKAGKDAVRWTPMRAAIKLGNPNVLPTLHAAEA